MRILRFDSNSALSTQHSALSTLSQPVRKVVHGVFLLLRLDRAWPNAADLVDGFVRGGAAAHQVRGEQRSGATESGATVDCYSYALTQSVVDGRHAEVKLLLRGRIGVLHRQVDCLRPQFI